MTQLLLKYTMEEEQIKQLLKYLETLGFNGDEFEKKIRQNISEGHLMFKIHHDIVFGKELMEFDLLLTHDYQFDAYRLTSYRAIYSDDPANADPKFLSKPVRDFSPNESGCANINLAYHILSGRLDELYGKLLPVGLDRFPAVDVYDFLEKKLSQNAKQFDLNVWFNTAEGYVEFEMAIEKGEYHYEPDAYKLSIAHHDPIRHGVIRAEDSAEIEAMMKSIDWKRGNGLYSFDEKRSADLIYAPEVLEVMNRLKVMEQDDRGREIAIQLKLKYWIDAGLFNDLISQEAWDYMREKPVVKYEFAANVDVETAYNLLCGRSIPENLLYTFLPETDNWIRLNLDNEEPISVVATFGTKEFEKAISMLPVLPAEQLKLLYPLAKGSLVEAILRTGKKVILEANPEQQTISIYTLEMCPIHTNLMMDPDWKMQLVEQKINQKKLSGTEHTQPKIRLDNKYKRNKGKGI